jgi:DNA processing protein
VNPAATPTVHRSEPGLTETPTASPKEFLARLAAIVAAPAPRVGRELLAGGHEARSEHLDGLAEPTRRTISEMAERLRADHVGILLPEDPVWPIQVNVLPSPPAYLFARGNTELLRQPAIGMCGSRRASERGLDAARLCGETVAARGWHVVSGYAKGVDTETHLAALRAGGNTVIVLAEGILHFRRKRAFDGLPFNARTVLVISQFPPNQRWTAGGAMTRNGLIVTLGGALVVIEAGETGGTLNAGRTALKLRRPVFALEFSDGPRKGNETLIDDGARALRTRGELAGALEDLAA